MYQSAGGLVQKCLFLSHTCRVSNSVGLGLTKLFFFFFFLTYGSLVIGMHSLDVRMFTCFQQVALLRVLLKMCLLNEILDLQTGSLNKF